MVICKESSKPSKLSTKLSTIWQINDYLSKKIDNRLIVDIIDTRGHPESEKGTKQAINGRKRKIIFMQEYFRNISLAFFKQTR